ncbi:MAG TPA: hypothetical protein ENJ44_00625, partial [Oceanospirillales bacterium]|nr:hypothetical protein [Oceanospirillales bacterium]
DDAKTDPAVAPYNSINFNYVATRSDQTTAYIAGAKTAMTQRLESIDSKIDGTVVRTYSLNYDYSSHTGRSLLTSISECRVNDCLPDTTFDWSQPNQQFSASSTTSNSLPLGIKDSKLGDINADGRADLVFINNSDVFKVAYADGANGFSVTVSTALSAPTGSLVRNKWHLIDYNADGRTDLIKQSGGYWKVYLAKAGTNGFYTSENEVINTWIATSSTTDFQVIDVNGDGLSDLVYEQDNALKVRFLEKSGSSYAFASADVLLKLPDSISNLDGVAQPDGIIEIVYSFKTKGSLNLRSHDVNGDGVADLILKTEIYTETINNTGSYRFISAGSAGLPPNNVFESSHWIAFIGHGLDGNGDLDYVSENHNLNVSINDIAIIDNNIKFADINADGMTDTLYMRYNGDDGDNSPWYYRLSDGTKFLAEHSVSTLAAGKDVQLVDFNNDGNLDIFYPSSGATNNLYYAKVWNGNGFNNGIATGAYGQNLDTYTNLFMDLDGDGRVDHFQITNTGIQKIYPRIDRYQAVDKITDFTNGLGAKTTVIYKPMTFSTVYNQGGGANLLDYGNSSPVFDFLGSMYVVREVTTDAPTDDDANATTSMQYQYAQARVQAGGRGFLGFAKIVTTVPTKNTAIASNKVIQTTTLYRQDFPYIGLPETVNVILKDGVLDIPIDCSISQTDCFPTPCEPDNNNCQINRNLEEVQGSPTLLSKTSNIVNKFSTVGKAQFAYIQSTTEETYKPSDGTLLKTRYQTTTHDGYGNPLTNTVKIYNGAYDSNNPNTNLLHTTTTTNIYSNTTSNWKIGLLKSTSTTVSRPSPQASVTTTIQYDYDAVTGLLTEERRLPDDGDDKFLRIVHQYDRFGNENKTISCSGEDFTSSQCEDTSDISNENADVVFPKRIHRYNAIIFDAKGRYANQVENSLAQTVSSITARDIYGNPKTSTDLLNTITTNTYDTFGNAVSSYSTLGTWNYVSKKWCSDISGTTAAACPSNAVIRVTKIASGGAQSYDFIDKLGRTVATHSRSFNDSNDGNTSGDDRWIVTAQYFDNLGRVTSQVGPYFYGASSANIPLTSTEYDRFNRVTKVVLPDNATETVSYNGFTTTSTNDLNQTKIETKNALGQIISAQDYLGSTLNYSYNVQGLVTEIKRTTNSTTELLIKNSYDKAGRKITSEDVDTGTTTTSYNAEGEIISVTDA